MTYCKIEEIFPCGPDRPNGPKLQIHVRNLAQDPCVATLWYYNFRFKTMKTYWCRNQFHHGCMIRRIDWMSHNELFPVLHFSRNFTGNYTWAWTSQNGIFIIDRPINLAPYFDFKSAVVRRWSQQFNESGSWILSLVLKPPIQVHLSNAVKRILYPWMFCLLSVLI